MIVVAYIGHDYRRPKVTVKSEVDHSILYFVRLCTMYNVAKETHKYILMMVINKNIMYIDEIDLLNCE